LDDLVTFDVRDHLDGLRSRETSWLRARHEELLRVQRRAHVEDLAVVAILDERQALADAAARDGVSERSMREHVETARMLAERPEIARVAHDGAMSEEQLASAVQLADESTDGEWADRAPNCSPVDLRRMVRTRAKPTVEESWRRRDARCLWMKWEEQRSMLRFGGELPDVVGAEFEATINELVDKLRPERGGTWDTRAHRAADALVLLCRGARRGWRHGGGHDGIDDGDGRDVPRLASRANLQVQVPLDGPATIAGIPIPDAKLEQLRANATVEAVLVDEHGAPVAVGRRFCVLSDKIARSVSLRDGHCRWPGCDARVGLEIHHLVPRSLGGTDELANLAAVCTLAHHHEQLIPHGPYALVGNPNMPDGLRLVVYAELSSDEARTYGLPPPPGHRRRRE
jgi:hypothetical protein